MATDKFKFLALECAQLPDDGLMSVLARDITLDEGDLTRVIQGKLAYAPRSRNRTPEQTATIAPFLRVFRNGPLDTAAAMLDLATAPPTLTLPVGLRSYWPLAVDPDDIVGTSHLVNNNGVTFVSSGPRGRMADFIRASSQHLSSATIGNALDWSLGFSVAGWFRFTDPGFAGTFFSIGVPVSAGGPGNFSLGSSGVPSWMFANCQGGLPIVNAGTTDAGAAGDGQLHFVVATYDGTDSLVRQYVDGVLVGTSPNPTSGHPVTTGGSALLALGAVIPDTSLVASGFTSQQWGRFGIWNKALSLGEIASLFNSGNGKFFSELTAADKVGLLSYYNLTEQSGPRADSMGLFPLADNNTVGSTIAGPLNMPATAANFVQPSLQYFSGGPVIDLSQDFTVAWWQLKPTGGIGGSAWIGTEAATFLAQTLTTGNPTLANFQAQAHLSAPVTVATSTPYNHTVWNHSLAAWNAATKTLDIYINGVFQGTDSGTGTVPTPALMTIGRHHGGLTAEGMMSSVNIWSRILSAAERAYLYNQGDGGFFPFPPLFPV